MDRLTLAVEHVRDDRPAHLLHGVGLDALPVEQLAQFAGEGKLPALLVLRCAGFKAHPLAPIERSATQRDSDHPT